MTRISGTVAGIDFSRIIAGLARPSEGPRLQNISQERNGFNTCPQLWSERLHPLSGGGGDGPGPSDTAENCRQRATRLMLVRSRASASEMDFIIRSAMNVASRRGFDGFVRRIDS